MANLLVVDDHILCRLSLRTSLEKVGHRVREARNGFEAIDACLREMPELVLLDIMMPEKDGVETLIHLRQLAPKLPIVMMSDGGELNFEPVFNVVAMLGATTVLRKPFTLQTLVATLETVLSDPAAPAFCSAGSECP